MAIAPYETSPPSFRPQRLHSDGKPRRPAREDREYFQRISEATSLGLRISACLALRSCHSGCQACAKACPSGALSVTDHGLEMKDGCLGCGRCAAACPTGALTLPGFVRAAVDAGEKLALTLDCWKVPRSESVPGALRVPCLGGLAVSRLLALRTAAGNRAIVLQDRGWCGQCSAGRREAHPAREVVDAANRLLGAAGIRPEQHIHLRPALLPARMMPERIPDADQERAVSRRDFFRGLAGRVTATVNDVVSLVPVQAASSMPNPRTRVRSYERERVLGELRALTRSLDRPMPLTVFNALEVSDRCCNHRVCAATCPTGALQSYRDEGAGVSGIAFDAERCIGCGHCERVCPEQAMRILRGRAVALPQGPEKLTRFGVAECAACGKDFSVEPGEGERICMNCRKGQRLARSAFRQLFGGERHPTRE